VRRAGSVFGAAHRAVLVGARFGDAVRDEVDCVEPAHVLLFEEIGGVALALGKDRDEHIGARDLLLAGGLDVDDGALDDTLEGGSRTGVLPVGYHEAIEFLVDEVLQIALKGLDVDIAAIEDGDGVAVVGQRQEQVLERGELMRALTRQVHRLMQSLFQTAGERGHVTGPTVFPSRIGADAGSCGLYP
jgi:hypothetical protein